MKNFLIRSLLFISLPAILYIGAFTFLKNQFRRNIDKHTIVILGDSQTKYIKHPDLFNYSINGSAYFVHFEFVKEFSEQLKNKKIYIGCNYNNLSKLYQNRLANDTLYPGWRDIMFKRLDEYYLLNYKHNEVRPSNLKYNVFNIKKLFNLFQNIYVNDPVKNSMLSVKNDTTSITNTIQSHWLHTGYILDDSIQRNYLSKLITSLKSFNCDVALLKMPLTSYYKDNVPLEIKNDYFNIANNLKIRVVDLDVALSISNNYNYFKDYGHLNKSGDTLIFNYFTENEIKNANKYLNQMTNK